MSDIHVVLADFKGDHMAVTAITENSAYTYYGENYKYEKGKSYPQADTMFALMELYEANLYDIIKDHEEDEQSSSVHIMEYMMAA
jgi:hypothetical protein